MADFNVAVLSAVLGKTRSVRRSTLMYPVQRDGRWTMCARMSYALSVSVVAKVHRRLADVVPGAVATEWPQLREHTAMRDIWASPSVHAKLLVLQEDHHHTFEYVKRVIELVKRMSREIQGPLAAQIASVVRPLNDWFAFTEWHAQYAKTSEHYRCYIEALDTDYCDGSLRSVVVVSYIYDVADGFAKITRHALRESVADVLRATTPVANLGVWVWRGPELTVSDRPPRTRKKVARKAWAERTTFVEHAVTVDVHSSSSSPSSKRRPTLPGSDD